MLNGEIAQYSNSASYLGKAIAISILLHLFAITLIVSLTKDKEYKDSPIVYETEFIPAPIIPPKETNKQRQQIVSPPEKTEKQAPNPEKRIFESEEDNFSIKEQIRRGEEGQANNQNKQSEKHVNPANNTQTKNSNNKTEPAPRAPKEIVKNSASNLKLKLDSASLAEISAAGEQKEKSTEEKLQREIQSQLQNQPSSINVSRLGSRDYIADIPDGEVTLLNTKANKFAVFVRRVASQVFANLRGAGWRSLNAGDIRAISKDASFEAILSPSGNLISIKMTSSSDSPRFDQVLGLAIKKGAKDPNPPQGAFAEDGNIHFIFQARSWVQITTNSRNGAPNERRWLVLGTGLE